MISASYMIYDKTNGKLVIRDIYNANDIQGHIDTYLKNNKLNPSVEIEVYRKYANVELTYNAKLEKVE